MNNLPSFITEEGAIISQRIKEFYSSLRCLFDTSSISKGIESSNKEFGSSSQGFYKGPPVNAYHIYPFFFIQEFPDVSIDTVREIAYAGYLYADHLIWQDRVLDGELKLLTPDGTKAILISNLLLHESLRILYSHLEPNSGFWSQISALVRDFSRSIYFENLPIDTRLSSFSYAQHGMIARGKSGLLKAAPIAMRWIGNHEGELSSISLSQDYVAEAFQLYDDLRDWRDDFNGQRYSYLIIETLRNGGYTTDILDGKNPSADSLANILYYSGIATKTLDLAEQLLDKATDEVKNTKCEYWKSYISHLQTNCRSLNDDVKKIVERNRSIYLGRVKPISISETIEKGLEYIKSMQSLDGYWEDFKTTAGLGREWVTSYILSCLFDLIDTTDFLIDARTWLSTCRDSEEGWGYNKRAIIDADSTAWALLALRSYKTKDLDLSKHVAKLLEFQDFSDGGFATYRNPKELESFIGDTGFNGFSGWCSSHVCVSAVSIQALRPFRVDLHDVAGSIDRGINFIILNQSGNGSWESYWWTCSSYATTQCIKALVHDDHPKINKYVSRAINWLVQNQLPDGSWSTGKGHGKTFDTGLALQGILATDRPVRDSTISRGIQWLCDQQTSDGSWLSYPILRIPHPVDHTPNANKYEIGTRGTGIIVRDQNNLFTTATALGALIDSQA